MEDGQVDLFNVMGGFRTADKIAGMRKINWDKINGMRVNVYLVMDDM
jgi:hypothetical protein